MEVVCLSNEEIHNQTPYNFQEHLPIIMLHLVTALIQYTIVAFVVMDLKIDLLTVHLRGQDFFVDIMMMLVLYVKQEQVRIMDKWINVILKLCTFKMIAH